MTDWLHNIMILNDILKDMSVHDRQGRELGQEAGFAAWRDIGIRTREARRRLFLIGNGASASMASHFATDIAKNGGLRTQIFTDASLLTAIGNDVGFEDIFAEPLRWYAEDGDILTAISSSGNSPDIIKAVRVARTAGCAIVTLSAMQADNRLRRLGDLNFYIAGATYGLAETAHAAILHHWMDIMEARKNG